MSSSRVLILFAALAALPLTLAGQVFNAIPNDHRSSAGRMADGVLHVELEAVLTEWRPRCVDGPVLRAAAVAEAPVMRFPRRE